MALSEMWLFPCIVLHSCKISHYVRYDTFCIDRCGGGGSFFICRVTAAIYNYSSSLVLIFNVLTADNLQLLKQCSTDI